MNPHTRCLKPLMAVVVITAFFVFLPGRESPVQAKDTDQAAPGKPHQAEFVLVENKSVPLTYQAPGSMESLREIRVTPMIQAQVEEMTVSAGDQVQKGDLLVRLDDRTLKSGLEQSLAELETADAELERAESETDRMRARLEMAENDHQRTETLYADQVVSTSAMDRARSDFLQARAALASARKAVQQARKQQQSASARVKEMRTRLSYTRISSPASGRIIQRMVEPGDQAAPGRALLAIDAGERLRAEISVGEKEMAHVRMGQAYPLHIDALDRTVQGVVEEIEPRSRKGSRSFLVKLGLYETIAGIYPGMFVRAVLCAGREELLLVPEQAVIRAGQLEMADLATDDGIKRVHIRTGRKVDGSLQVLSGLKAGDRVRVP
ncbi:MAG: efflux RND transporter periplasmic adaptor subunit [Desulfonatronovibrionaceae bacterium]